MAVERGLRARLRYRWEAFLGGGAGKQLFFLFVLTMVLVVVFAAVSLLGGPLGVDLAEGGVLDRAWFYFTRFLDAGTMGGDAGNLNRFISTAATIAGVVVAGLLISSLAGNFQEALESIRRGSSPVIETGHFLILGWSEKIFSVIDQLSEANVDKGRIIVVVMADQDKVLMEEALEAKVKHLDRVKLVVRAGSSVSLGDLSRVASSALAPSSCSSTTHPTPSRNQADGRVIKTSDGALQPPGREGAASTRSTSRPR